MSRHQKLHWYLNSYNYQSLYFQLKMCCLLDMLNTTMPRFQSHNNLHYIHM